ncbi:MAG: cadherin-like beta sandwich domain-containing protein, partial [Patescibacteria group bacterium]
MRLRTAAIFIVPALILLMAGCGPPPPADDASLSGLAISSGTLTPAFSPAVTDYTVDVPYSITGVTVTPTTADDGATVTVEGVPVISGNPSATIDLNAGEAEAIAIVVTAADGTTTRTYTIVATRSGCRFSADADTVALWHFDELSGQTVYDASTNGLDLVFGDSDAVEPAKDPTWVSSGRDGFGGAISVDGTETAGQYARSGLVSGYISTNYSVEF